MDFPAIIAQLKTFATVFGGRVAGAAEFSQAMTGEFRPEDFPAAYVIPLGEDAEPNDTSNALYQTITERFGIVVEFSNTADRRGQGATEQLHETRRNIFAAILNWRGLEHDRAPRGVEAAGGAVLQVDRARLFYQWEFTLGVLFSELDGWQEPAPPLLEIVANDPATYPGAPPPPFSVSLQEPP